MSDEPSSTLQCNNCIALQCNDRVKFQCENSDCGAITCGVRLVWCGLWTKIVTTSKALCDL